MSDLSQLTPKQAKFVAGVIELDNYSAAYRQAYDVTTGTAKTVAINAHRLANQHTRIAPILQKAKQRMADNAEVTAQTILEELEEARKLAIKSEQPGAAVSASAHKAKLLGLNAPERREQVNIDGTPQDLSRKVETARKALNPPVQRIEGNSGTGLPTDSVKPASEPVSQPSNGTGTTVHKE